MRLYSWYARSVSRKEKEGRKEEKDLCSLQRLRFLSAGEERERETNRSSMCQAFCFLCCESGAIKEANYPESRGRGGKAVLPTGTCFGPPSKSLKTCKIRHECMNAVFEMHVLVDCLACFAVRFGLCFRLRSWQL